MNKGGGARSAIWVGVLVLAVLHYDFWFWDDSSLWFGFMPVGLGYQALISLAAGGLWLAATKYAWPAELEAWASEGDRSEGKRS